MTCDRFTEVIHNKFCPDFLFNVFPFLSVEMDEVNCKLKITEGSFLIPAEMIQLFYGRWWKHFFVKIGGKIFKIIWGSLYAEDTQLYWKEWVSILIEVKFITRNKSICLAVVPDRVCLFPGKSSFDGAPVRRQRYSRVKLPT